MARLHPRSVEPPSVLRRGVMLLRLWRAACRFKARLAIQAIRYIQPWARQVSFDICSFKVLSPGCECSFGSPAARLANCSLIETFPAFVLLNVLIESVRFTARAALGITNLPSMNELTEGADEMGCSFKHYVGVDWC